MRNILAISVILIPLGVPAARGDVGQTQIFVVDAANSAVHAGSAGVTPNVNFTVVGQNQETDDLYGRVTALQSQDGVILQGAIAGSDGGGAVGVGQTASMVGGQLQNVVGSGPGAQDQTLSGSLGQETVNANGMGAALGIQACICIQAQAVFSPRGVSSNGQWLAVGDVVTVGAAP
jgi:hypothetical protein